MPLFDGLFLNSLFHERDSFRNTLHWHLLTLILVLDDIKEAQDAIALHDPPPQCALVDNIQMARRKDAQRNLLVLRKGVHRTKVMLHTLLDEFLVVLAWVGWDIRELVARRATAFVV